MHIDWHCIDQSVVSYTYFYTYFLRKIAVVIPIENGQENAQ